jgi:hypothetical protein
MKLDPRGAPPRNSFGVFDHIAQRWYNDAR